MDQCSPKYSDQTISCFTKDALLKIVEAYNRKHPDKIKTTKSHNKRQIWDNIQSKLSETCGNNETCWLNQNFLKPHAEDLDQYFKPLAPLGRYQWLTTDDIYNVMKQWDEKYEDFKFIGPLPIDFLDLSDDDSTFLQTLDLQSTPYTNIGVIFNLDPSTKGGSHWVSLSIDKRRKEVNFFDSYGDKHTYNNKYKLPYYNSFSQKMSGNTRMAMPLEIQRFIYGLLTQMGSLQRGGGGINYKVKVNTIQHQYANSECGVYSMMFLLKSLNNTFEKITQDIVVDEMANQYRDEFFRRV